MTRVGPKDVELVGHRCRGHCRPGAEAGSQSGTQVPRPLWDRGTETSQVSWASKSGADRNRTDDLLLAKQDRLSAVLHAVIPGQ